MLVRLIAGTKRNVANNQVLDACIIKPAGFEESLMKNYSFVGRFREAKNIGLFDLLELDIA